jgi:4-hydroxybenzoate polyprenyltransferase
VARVAELLRLVRFREWFYFLALPLAGVDLGRGAAANAWPVARGVAVAFCVLAFGYLLNAASDLGVDVDPRKNPLLAAGGRTPARATAAALAAAGVGLSAFGEPAGLIAALVAIASGTVYSVGPRLKGVPVLGTLANATNFVPLLWVGAAAHDPPLARQLAPAFAGVLLQSQIVHEAADAAGDARAGVRTTFLALGRAASVALAALFGAWPVTETALPGWTRGALLVVFAVAFPVALARCADPPSRAAALRRWHRLAGVAVGAALFVRAAM